MNCPTILTENLCLRPFTQSDAITMHKILNGKDVLRYFPGTQTPTLEQVERMIGRLLTHRTAPRVLPASAGMGNRCNVGE